MHNEISVIERIKKHVFKITALNNTDEQVSKNSISDRVSKLYVFSLISCILTSS